MEQIPAIAQSSTLQKRQTEIAISRFKQGLSSTQARMIQSFTTLMSIVRNYLPNHMHILQTEFSPAQSPVLLCQNV